MDTSRMDLEPVRIPKRTQTMNLLTGIFLKSVYFLNKDLTKTATVGIFRDKADSLGIVFKSKKGYVYWSWSMFNEFVTRFDEINKAIENKTRTVVKTESGDLKLVNSFGKWYVYLYDGEHTLSLTVDEWCQFTASLPCVKRCMRELFLWEHVIKSYILDRLTNLGEYTAPPEGLPPHWGDRLFDEITQYGSGC